jgi:hypothetical protein
LGLLSKDDQVPAESTYYLFRKRIVDHEKETGENLLEKAFSQLTGSQAADYKVSGKRLRMDSKLLGSNIAWCSRYELVHDALAVFFNGRRTFILNRNTLSNADTALL